MAKANLDMSSLSFKLTRLGRAPAPDSNLNVDSATSVTSRRLERVVLHTCQSWSSCDSEIYISTEIYNHFKFFQRRDIYSLLLKTLLAIQFFLSRDTNMILAAYVEKDV